LARTYMGGTCAFRVICATSFSVQNIPSTCVIGRVLYPLSFEVVHVVDGGIVFCQRHFLVSSSFLSCSFEIHTSCAEFQRCSLIYKISISIFILLISNFCSYVSYRTLIFFSISSFNPDLWYFFQFDPYFFDFFGPFVKLIFFSTSLFNKIVFVFLISILTIILLVVVFGHFLNYFFFSISLFNQR